MTILELYPDKFTVDPITNCWLFKGAKDEKGYGQIRYGGLGIFRVHRLSAFLSGILTDLTDRSLHALHKLECPNKHCANPEHLYAGDGFDNQRDSVIKGTHISPRKFVNHCKYGHLLEGENLYVAKDGRRRCNICRKENAKRHYQISRRIVP